MGDSSEPRDEPGDSDPDDASPDGADAPPAADETAVDGEESVDNEKSVDEETIADDGMSTDEAPDDGASADSASAGDDPDAEFGAPPEASRPADGEVPEDEIEAVGDGYATVDEEFAESFGEPPESAHDTVDEWESNVDGEPAPALPDESEPSSTDVIESGAIDGPSSDEEMPLAAHIEEMIRRLAIVFGVGGLVTLLAYPASEFLIEFLWQSYVPQPDVNRPYIYGPLEFVLTKLKVAGISGTIVGLPVFVYESYRFMKPGLYPTERRYYLASVPTSLILAFVGVAFSHFVILPLTVLYFTTYTENAAVVAFGLRETFSLIVLLMGYMAIVFQIPLFVMLAIMMGLVTRQWMEDKRILFWGGFGGLAFTFVTVDPTGMAPIIIAVTMIFLFEGTLLLLRWTGN